MQHYQIQNGFIELICGCMFAGKTEELIRRISVLKRGRKEVLIFKPQFDNRYWNTTIKSHSGIELKALSVSNCEQIEDILQKSKKVDVLAFDEMQFFPPEFSSYLEKKANQGYHIICAGLDKGYNDEMFVTMMRLFSIAEFVTKLMAVCVICGNMATKTQRIDENNQPIGPSKVKNVIGGAESYQARCRECYQYFAN